MADTALAEENVRLRARLAEAEAALADAQDAQRRLESIVSEALSEETGLSRAGRICSVQA